MFKDFRIKLAFQTRSKWCAIQPRILTLNAWYFLCRPWNSPRLFSHFYLLYKTFIHRMASESLTVPIYTWIVFRLWCLSITLRIISKGTPLLLVYIAKCRRQSHADTLGVKINGLADASIKIVFTVQPPLIVTDENGKAHCFVQSPIFFLNYFDWGAIRNFWSTRLYPPLRAG